jgi:formylglycine-generating enzyme required for sulfatase activity
LKALLGPLPRRTTLLVGAGFLALVLTTVGVRTLFWPEQEASIDLTRINYYSDGGIRNPYTELIENEIEDQLAWDEARRLDTIAGYQAYLQDTKSNRYVSAANKYIAQLEKLRTPETGEAFRDAFISGSGLSPLMVVIPAGSFTMGSPSTETGRYDNEDPQRTVTIGSDFAVGRYEVTWVQYSACVSDGACPAAADDGFGKGNRPVTYVDWEAARKYESWLSGKTGETYRLLSESEWEYAARAGTSSAYWWGSSASHEYANYGADECCSGLASGRDQWESTSPAGSFPANAFGLYDMHGNVWEWTQDCWNSTYYGAPADGAPWTSGDCSVRVLRGGSWFNFPQFLRSANRIRDNSSGRFDSVGFRVARTP